MLAMSRIGYDAMVVGNHELNFGLESLSAARDERALPVAVGQHRDRRRAAAASRPTC